MYIYINKFCLLFVHACVLQFCRWSLLITGIAYGAYFQNKFSKRENARREEELRLKPMRDAKLAEEKRLELIGKIFYVECIYQNCYVILFNKIILNVSCIEYLRIVIFLQL